MVPLTVATDAKRRDVARAAALLLGAEYVFARTMPENPHYYTPRRTWAHDADFVFALESIRRYGHREKYVPPGETRPAYEEVVFHAGAYFWWGGWLPISACHWINRKSLPAPVTPEVVDQTLIVHDARRLEIPPVPDGFHGLDAATTRCPHFQAGVHLFGYATWDERPRLRKKGMAR